MPFVVGATVTAITVALTWLFLDESLPKEKRQQRAVEGRARMTVREIIVNHPLLLIMVIGFCAQFSIAVLQSTITLFAAAELFPGQTDRQVNLGVGLMLTCIGLGQVVTQLFLIRPALKRFGERRLVVFGDVMRALGLLSIVLFASPWLVGGVSLVMVAVASGLMMPSLQGLATMSVREEINGGALGLYNSATSLGLIIGTSLGGSMFDIGARVPFLIAGGVMLMTVIPALLLYRSTAPAASPTPVPASSG
jgi:DHA1 family multidrug resistance protein-like MFS transporter